MRVIAAYLARLVELVRRNAAAIVGLCLALTAAAGLFAATNLSVDTDIDHMLPRDLAWRQDEIALDRAFPQNNSILVAVIDGRSGAEADRAATRLAERMRAEPALFRHVRQPDGGPFFDRNGFLFLSQKELQDTADKLISAQPLIGSLAKDPSLRGLFDTLALFVNGAGMDQGAIDRLNPALSAIAEAVNDTVAGRDEPLSWEHLMTGRKAGAGERRRFVITRPVLDFGALEPGGRARAAMRRLAGEVGIDAQHGLQLRLTGPVALDDEQFSTLRAGALESTALSIVAVCAILFAALRSARLVGVILMTLITGLVLTAAFAAAVFGSLNLISVAFGVLFIGLAVDFGIQFGVRYRDQRHRAGTLPAALDGTARSIGPALLLAAGATAIGFLSFVPTAYTGIRELGWIAGVGMLIAIALNLIMLPSALAIVRPRGEPEPIGFRWAAPLDRALLARRRWVIAGAAVLAVLGIAVLPLVRFDFDPLNLKNPHSESVATVRDLMKDPMSTPYTAEVLTASLTAAQQLAARLEKLPEVAHAITIASYVPDDQDKKLSIIGDLALLLGPTLSPPVSLPPPSDGEVISAMIKARTALRPVAARAGEGSPAARLARGLDAAVARGAAAVPALNRSLLTGLRLQLASLTELMQAQKVTLASLPAELRAGWINPQGQARVEVFPKGKSSDPAILARFVTAVRTVAPHATGSPVTIQEAGHLISSSFVQAGIIAVVAITILLIVVLRRLRDVAVVIAPLLLAGILTLAVTVAIGMPLNYANIIALPLLLGIGVAFDIYFVMNWRAGQDRHLQSSTARAVVFSALTTMSAFGSLVVSQDPGTAQMGELLVISLACTLFCTLVVLPALLGPARAPKQAIRAVPRPEPPVPPPQPSRPARAGGAAVPRPRPPVIEPASHRRRRQG
jgi:hopanoid biosynthesis associated RND transporter like protein HpnN